MDAAFENEALHFGLDAAFENEVLHFGFWYSGSRQTMDAAFQSEVLHVVFKDELMRREFWEFYVDLDLRVRLPFVLACYVITV